MACAGPLVNLDLVLVPANVSFKPGLLNGCNLLIARGMRTVSLARASGGTGLSTGGLLRSCDGSSGNGVSKVVAGSGVVACSLPVDGEDSSGAVNAGGILFAAGNGRAVSGDLGMTGWYARRNFLLRRVTLPDPSTRTTYWSNWRTSITTPVLSHFVGYGPV